MKCTIDGRNARVFAKSIQSLSKFGSDLFVEADQNNLLLRSLNNTKSAVGIFAFCQNFFDDYESGSSSEIQETFFKISMKACLAAFKNMKQVESCQLVVDNIHSKFQVKLKCRLETVKTSLISIVDEENITAAHPINNASNSITGSHRLFTEISNNFQAAEEEITFEASKDAMNVKNYIEGSRVNNKFMRSSFKLTSAEFEKYDIMEETVVTYCLKEFRAFLLFAESVNENLTLNFDKPGSPIVFTIKKIDQIEGNLIMSTLDPEDVSFYDDCKKSESFNMEAPVQFSNKRKNNFQSGDNNSTEQSALYKIGENPTNNISDLSHGNLERTIINCETFDNSRNKDIIRQTTEESAIFELRENTSNTSSLNVARKVEIISTKYNIKDMSTISNTAQTSTRFNTASQKELHNDNEISVKFVDTEENIEYIKKFPTPESRSRGLRSIFSRCFDATFIPCEPSPSSQVYVPNSDSEE